MRSVIEAMDSLVFGCSSSSEKKNRSTAKAPTMLEDGYPLHSGKRNVLWFLVAHERNLLLSPESRGYPSVRNVVGEWNGNNGVEQASKQKEQSHPDVATHAGSLCEHDHSRRYDHKLRQQAIRGDRAQKRASDQGSNRTPLDSFGEHYLVLS